MNYSRDKKLKCLVVEDEQPAQWVLRHFIEQSPFLELIAVVYDSKNAKEIIDFQNIDLLFLDINLPGLSGIEFLNTLTKQPPVIFTTAYAAYAAVSFDYNVIDYLLKPITEEHFNRAVQRAIDKFLLDNVKTPEIDLQYSSIIDIPIGSESVPIETNAITYLQSWGNYVKIFTTEKMVLASISTQKLLDMLPSNKFIRVHKSFTVNKIHISSWNQKEIVIGTNTIPIGISYRQSIHSILNHYES